MPCVITERVDPSLLCLTGGRKNGMALTEATRAAQTECSAGSRSVLAAISLPSRARAVEAADGSVPDLRDGQPLRTWRFPRCRGRNGAHRE